MTNLLRHRLPITVEYENVVYAVDYRFSTILRIFALLNDDLFPEEERMKRAINLFYRDKYPEDVNIAAYLMLEFISDEDNAPSENTDTHQEQLISFEEDANMIYSYFLRVYHIDLQEEQIHWYKFKALVQDVGETPLLSSAVSIRNTDPNTIPKERRNKFMKIKRALSLGNKGTNKVETLEERNKRWLMDT